MTDQDAARQKIAELVEKWRATPAKQREGYTEQQTRIAFILPLFEALGWNIQNPSEVSAEEQISRGFVDFGFYFNGVPAFYLETKRAAEKLEKPEFMRQSINYAYLKGVTWAVLTDFEQLMVFNAEWETNDPVQARFLDLHWEHYADEQFDDLWLLSKPAFTNREIDRTAERFGKKAKKQPVTDTLFKQLTTWRREMFEQMRVYGTKLWSTDSRLVDNAVQKLLDRLIFIRTVEDRGVEPPRLQAVLRQSKRKDLFSDLLKLFRELDAIYNSNLFAQSELDLMEVHDPDLIIEMVNGLYKAPGGYISYDFNAITADVLGAVYEQYLGFKAQDPQGKQALDPRKQEKRKKQGIYYTPQFVVRYIVRQTLGKLLETGGKSDTSRTRGITETVGFSPLPEGRPMTPEEAHSLRILDPACGSGSFLIEAFDVLDRWLAQNGTAEDKQFPRRRRLRILQENLYGVDLDEQAVEVTRLNLMLRAAQDREKLPLLTHIQHGNSLIDDPAIAGDAAFKWAERFPQVFAGRTRPLWFVTFVTHNSRVSERMVTYGVQTGEPLIFSPPEQILMAEIIAEACRNYAIPVVAWNVLPDHVHMVIGAETEDELNEQIRKLKGFASYTFQRALNWESGQPVWAQKFNKWLITDEKALREILEYVLNNHEKHTERWGEILLKTWNEGVTDASIFQQMNAHLQNKGLKPLVVQNSPRPLSQIIHEICISPEDAAHIPGGFDVVIGNPPYVRQETLGTDFKTFAEAHYETYAGTNDLYVYFIEKELKLLKSGGLFGIIVANKWMRAGYGKTLRTWLKGQRIEEIIDFGDLPVFQDATAYPCIIIARPAAPLLSQNKGLKPLALQKTSPVSDSRLQPIAPQPSAELTSDSGLQPIAQSPTLQAEPMLDGDLPPSDSRLQPTAPTTQPTAPDHHPTLAVTQVKTLDFLSLETYIQQHGYRITRASLDDNGWSLAPDHASALLGKLRAAGVPLGDYVEKKIYRGVLTGLNEAFVIDAPTRERIIREDPRSAELIKPFLAGRDVKRYAAPHIERYLILIPNGWTRQQMEAAETVGFSPLHSSPAETAGFSPLPTPSSPLPSTPARTTGFSPLSDSPLPDPQTAWTWFSQSYPAIAAYLKTFEAKAVKRTDKGEYWWELRPCSYYEAFEKPKIMYPSVAQRGAFTLDFDKFFVDKTCYFISSGDRYLLGLLNSQLLYYYFSKIGVERRGNYFEHLTTYVEQLPIRPINFDDPADKAKHDRMVELVQTMLRLKSEHAAAEAAFDDRRHQLAEQIAYTDRQIDTLVYELYELTEAEIRIVEGA